MSPILRAGVSIVFLALASYTAGVLLVQRRRAVSSRALGFLLAGVVFDVTATVCMILGSGRLVTLHGVIGYSALAAMVVDTWFAWRHRRRSGEAATPQWLHRLTRFAYLWWVVAFVTGALLAAMMRTAA
jgi:heme/copper-type cytochrome/quinol oxidase subunit 2